MCHGIGDREDEWLYISIASSAVAVVERPSSWSNRWATFFIVSCFSAWTALSSASLRLAICDSSDRRSKSFMEWVIDSNEWDALIYSIS